MKPKIAPHTPQVGKQFQLQEHFTLVTHNCIGHLQHELSGDVECEWKCCSLPQYESSFKIQCQSYVTHHHLYAQKSKSRTKISPGLSKI